MSTQTNKRRICQLFYGRFHGKFIWISAQEQVWLDASDKADQELGALADAAKDAADRARSAIDDAMSFIAASNKRIARSV